jgi:dTDP-4-dehydrorhamnose reductase
MRFLVVEPAGMVGHAMCMVLAERGHEVLGFGGEELCGFEHLCNNLHNDKALSEILSGGCFDAVVNCSAVVNQFAEQDKAEAAYINSYLPHLMERVTAGTPTIVVNRSTDCVFSGAKGSYTVNDVPDAGSFYARTKAVGELNNGKDLTIRVSLIGPERKPGIGLLDWFLRQQGEVRGFANALWTGVTTIEFARVVEQLVAYRAHGLVHCSPVEAISKYELLRLFAEFFPTTNRSVVRFENDPVDKSLVPEWANHEVAIPTYREMVEDIAAWVAAHRNMYPSYYARS